MKKKIKKSKVYELDFGETNIISAFVEDIIAIIETEMRDMKVGEELNYTITTKMMSQKKYDSLEEWA